MRTLLDVRRLAAVDMYGMSGRPRRRTMIRAEFIAGVVGCCALGLIVMLFSHGIHVALGAYLVSIGLNYVPLAAYAHALRKPGALERELRGVDLTTERRSAGIRQLWIVIPLAVVLASVRDR